MRFINKAGLLAGGLTTLLILASCSDSGTSTGVTTGKQLANDSSTQVVMHQATAGNGEHSIPETFHAVCTHHPHGDIQIIVCTSLPVTNTTPSTTTTTPATTITPITTTTPSTATTPTTTSTTVRAGRQAANELAPDPAPPPATTTTPSTATTQVATTPAATTTVIVETISPAEVEGPDYLLDEVRAATTQVAAEATTPEATPTIAEGGTTTEGSSDDPIICPINHSVRILGVLYEFGSGGSSQVISEGDTKCEAVEAESTKLNRCNSDAVVCEDAAEEAWEGRLMACEDAFEVAQASDCSSGGLCLPGFVSDEVREGNAECISEAGAYRTGRLKRCGFVQWRCNRQLAYDKGGGA